jgi:hypothetical protein
MDGQVVGAIGVATDKLDHDRQVAEDEDQMADVNKI